MEFPDELKKTIELRVSYQGDKYYDKDWRQNSSNLLYHPDYNLLGSTFRYKTLNIPHSDLYGTLVFSRFSIEEIITGKEDLVITGLNGDTSKVKDEKCYFVRLKYIVAARILNDNKFEVFQVPKDFDWYWLLVKDPHDGLYKIFDELPSFKVNFTSMSAFLNNSDKFAQGAEIVNQLQKIAKE